MEILLNSLAPYIAIASAVLAILALIYSVRSDQRKTGVEIRCTFPVTSSYQSAEQWVSEVRLENLKDRTVAIYKIYLQVGRGVYILVEDLSDNPLVLDAYSVCHRRYDPVEFYSRGMERLTDVFENKKFRRRIVLTTSQGRHYPKWNKRAKDDPFLDVLFGRPSLIAWPRRLSHKDRCYGSRAKYLVTYTRADGETEEVPIYPDYINFSPFSELNLTKESVRTKQTLELFLQQHVAEGAISLENIKVLDLDRRRQEVYKDYKESIPVPALNWFSYNIVARGGMLWESWRMERTNRRLRRQNT